MTQQHIKYTKMFLNYDNTNDFHLYTIYKSPNIHGNYNITMTVMKKLKKKKAKAKPLKKKPRKEYNMPRSRSPGFLCCVFVYLMYKNIPLKLTEFIHHNILYK